MPPKGAKISPIAKPTTVAGGKLVSTQTVEHHPLAPFLPADARIILLGTFPPPFIRWSVPFYYPNINNDMWKVMGLLFYNNDAERFITQRKESEIKEGMDAWMAQREMVQIRNGTISVGIEAQNNSAREAIAKDQGESSECDIPTPTAAGECVGMKRPRPMSRKPPGKKREVLKKTFLKADIEAFLLEKRIAIFDIATSICRLAGNAADDQLKIVEPTDIYELLTRLPECTVISPTGGLAHEYVVAAMLKVGTRIEAQDTLNNAASGTSTKGTSRPRKQPATIGEVERFLLPGNRVIHVIRCPSTSRANPMKLSVKAETYGKAFKLANVL